MSAGTGHQVKGIGTEGGGVRTVIIVKVDLPFFGFVKMQNICMERIFLNDCCIVKCWHAGLLDVSLLSVHLK